MTLHYLFKSLMFSLGFTLYERQFIYIICDTIYDINISDKLRWRYNIQIDCIDGIYLPSVNYIRFTDDN